MSKLFADVNASVLQLGSVFTRLKMVSTFLSLPLEVRILIYKYLLPYSIDQRFEPLPKQAPNPSIRGPRLALQEPESWAVRWFPGTCPLILFVDRQIHQEACEVLYRENAFELYIRHPKEPRLPMNDGRIDAESFILIAWAHSHWCHPRNPQLPLSTLLSHPWMSRIRNWRVNLPPLDDLMGVDAFMRLSSWPAFMGITKWISHCTKDDGQLDEQESSRMNYVKQFKDPIDDVAAYLKSLQRIDRLGMSFHLGRAHLNFLEYLLEGFQNLVTVKQVDCFVSVIPHTFQGLVCNHHSWPMIQDIGLGLSTKPGKTETTTSPILSCDANAMLKMVKAIQARQSKDNLEEPIED